MMKRKKIFSPLCAGAMSLIAFSGSAQISFNSNGKQIVIIRDSVKKQEPNAGRIVTFSTEGKQTKISDTLSNQQIKPSKKTKKVYYLPNGKVVAEDKVDSVAKAWGGLNMQRDIKKDPLAIYLLPPTPQNAGQAEAVARNQEQSLRSKLIDKVAPGFELKDLQGRKWDIAALKGKTVVLNFWFTECKPCIQEMPSLNLLQADFKGKNVVFLGLALNDAGNIKEFLKDNDFQYAILADSKLATAKYGIYAWPTHIIIDKNGFVKFLKVGTKNAAQEIETELKSML